MAKRGRPRKYPVPTIEQDAMEHQFDSPIAISDVLVVEKFRIEQHIADLIGCRYCVEYRPAVDMLRVTRDHLLRAIDSLGVAERSIALADERVKRMEVGA